jgi:ribosomal-protein-alanine N-acetyltransferase
MSDDVLSAVVGLELECGLNSRGIEGYRKIMADPRSILLVAIDESAPENIVGVFSSIVILDELQIDNLAVSACARRQGIGQLLLKSTLTIAASLGAHAAVLEVRSANLPARRFYEKNDFIVVGIRKRYYTAPVDDALLLIREIQKPIINVS